MSHEVKGVKREDQNTCNLGSCRDVHNLTFDTSKRPSINSKQELKYLAVSAVNMSFLRFLFSGLQ